MTALDDARTLVAYELREQEFDAEHDWTPSQKAAVIEALIAEHERLIGWQDKQNEIALLMEAQRSSETPPDLKVPSDDPSFLVSAPPADDGWSRINGEPVHDASYSKGWDDGYASIEAPTDDEREALRQAWIAGNGSFGDVRDAVLAAGFRRQGPITDEWEYGIRADGDEEPFTDYYDDIQTMRDEFDGSLVWHEGEHIARRRKAGPWEPIPDEAARDASN